MPRSKETIERVVPPEVFFVEIHGPKGSIPYARVVHTRKEANAMAKHEAETNRKVVIRTYHEK